MDLFADQEHAALSAAAPLAVRMRPQTLDEFVGQDAFLGEGKLMRRLLAAGRLASAVFWGPPGCGKTTLARIVAAHVQAAFSTLHAAEAGVKDVREVIEAARQRLLTRGQRTVLFLDEIHRFNRGQQDSLLRDVEDGVLILLGATTENPFFSINGPLLSRSQIFEFQPLTIEQIGLLLRRALVDAERGVRPAGASADDDALRFIAERCDGDARRALTALEVAVLSQHVAAGGAAGRRAPHVTLEIAADSMQRRAIPYDTVGDTHYDVTSALIKSMRGSDPDAAVYWLARMLEGGEDPRFIARRIAICASEDVGNADPQAIIVAAAAAQITEFVGVPECEFALAQATIYVAMAPKSNACAMAIWAAREDVRKGPTLPVPNHLRDRSYAGAKRLGRGAGYQYPHSAPAGFIVQDYLGIDRSYYHPTARGDEGRMAEQLRRFRDLREKNRAGESSAQDDQ